MRNYFKKFYGQDYMQASKNPKVIERKEKFIFWANILVTVTLVIVQTINNVMQN